MVNIPDAITTLVYKSIAENHCSDAFQISRKLKKSYQTFIAQVAAFSFSLLIIVVWDLPTGIRLNKLERHECRTSQIVTEGSKLKSIVH
jgi:hypothetical protein